MCMPDLFFFFFCSFPYSSSVFARTGPIILVVIFVPLKIFNTDSVHFYLRFDTNTWLRTFERIFSVNNLLRMQIVIFLTRNYSFKELLINFIACKNVMGLTFFK